MRGARRVCLVVGQLRRGGLEKQAFTLATNLVSDRWDVSVITLSPDGWWLEPLRRAGIRVVEIERRGRADVRRLMALAREFRRIRPEVVYSFNYEPNVYARLAAVIAGVPLRVTGERGIYLSGVQILVERCLQPWTACVVANAEAIRADLIGRVGLASSKVLTIPNGIEIKPPPDTAARVAARRELEVADDDVVAGTVARLDEVKNLDLLLDAAEIARRANPRLAVRIVGAGPDEARLRARIRERSLDPAVRLLGERPGGPLLAGMDIFVLTSRSEGMPNTVMEAMAAGLPCVCTEVGGCRELVVEGITGFLVAAGNAGELAARLGTLAADIGLRRRFGEAGRRRMAEEYSVGRLVTRTETLLMSLIEARDRRVGVHPPVADVDRPGRTR